MSNMDPPHITAAQTGTIASTLPCPARLEALTKFPAELSTLEAAALLTFRLHCEMLAGRGDDDAADAIRDALEPLWYKLTPAETASLTWWSERLYNDKMHKIPGTP